jgi:dihydrofolate reductase
MRIAIIAAIGKNRVIGKDGKLPWHISDDLKRFKRLTVGHPVLMGRKTWDSLGKPLPNRRNIVITSTPINDVECYRTINAALNALKDQQKVFVIGGAQIYGELFGRADELYLTFVDQQIEGDVYFPPFEDATERHFKVIAREKHTGYEFVDYVRAPEK